MNRDYFIDDLRMIEGIEEILPLIRHVKLYKPRNNPFKDLEEDEFKYKYRFTRSTAYCITEMVKNDLAGDARGGFIPPHLKVLPAIRTWARGEAVNNTLRGNVARAAFINENF
ncbi:unnamed protein product [Euphydryas editha]|uniref:Uncharacterized protein n=1 Tax=Euphydryas editha TaxID=104508 RepID=A0AAU9UT24_EUPED|nr:unnamed protein product [Euphydryas editha]